MIFDAFWTILIRSVNRSQGFNSVSCQNHVQRRSGSQSMTWRHSVCISETHTHSLSGGHMLSLADTCCLRKTHAVSGKHMLSVSRRRILFPENTSVSRRHIVFPEDTFCLLKTYSVSGRHDLFPEDTFSLPKTHSTGCKHTTGNE